MFEHGWGQMPVVEEDQVVGIVTRTDLIKLWSAPAEPSADAQEINARLEAALSPLTLALVHRIGQAADQMGYSVYFVGGLVRDLLLDIPIVDIDLVVEGDAIQLARHLQRQLGGRVRGHQRFGTAKWLIDPETAPSLVDALTASLPDQTPATATTTAPNGLPPAIDFVTARTEFYTHPTALPQVERSSIKQDLHRRDFTINTLAVRLDPERFGELLDFYGGEADLDAGIIRVLHSLSFIEDPTRILRAARLETRLNFQIELRTEQLIADAMPLLDRVSGDRLRHELVLIFREAEPEQALCRLHELGVLEVIVPGLRCDRWLKTRFQQLRRAVDDPAWNVSPAGMTVGYLGLLLYRLLPRKLKAIKKRLRLGRDDVKRLNEVQQIRERLPVLAQAEQASQIYRLLSSFSTRALLVAWAAEERVRAQIYRYQAELRDVETALDGHYLIEQYGLDPGPVFGRLLNRVRDARLDGQVTTRADEEALLEQLLEQMEHTGGDNV
jgi:tRNA nucleotidyltransferase (CCA-adding enzyme)